MDTGFIAFLSIGVTLISAIIGAVVGAIVPAILKRRDDKIAMRISPMIAIWDNTADCIEDKIKVPNTRWFIDVSRISDYFVNGCFFLVLRTEKSQKMLACNVSIETEGNGKTLKKQKYDIGVVDSTRKTVIPICYDNIKTSVSVDIRYKTVFGEEMRYSVNFQIDLEKSQDGANTYWKVLQRTDSLFLVKRKGKNHFSEIIIFKNKETNLTESFSSVEIQNALKTIRT